jgi:hypothetical protein
MVRTVLGLLRSTTRCRVGGMWQAVRAHIEGRNAVRFERERRATLLTRPVRTTARHAPVRAAAGRKFPPVAAPPYGRPE